MANHHFRKPWANNAADPQTPGPAGSDEERQALRAKRIIQFGMLALTVVLTKFVPPFLSTTSFPVSTSIRYPGVDGKLRDTPPPTAMARELLAAHNRYREAFGVPSLQWSDVLADHALDWANVLTAEKAFKHAHNPYHEGECLWMGTAGYFSYTNMVDDFGNEK